MKVECEKLTKIIMECFDNSMDDRFTPEERNTFLLQGKELREKLVDLLSAKFEKGTKIIPAANKNIEEISIKLKKKEQLLKNVAAVTGEIAELITVLDDLVKVAAGGVS